MRLNSLFKISCVAAGPEGRRGAARRSQNERQTNNTKSTKSFTCTHAFCFLYFSLCFARIITGATFRDRTSFAFVLRLPFAGAVIHDAYLKSEILLWLLRLQELASIESR